MADDLKVAVIGCGRMGAHTRPEVRAALPPGWWPLNHADAASSVPGLRLVAFCDTNQDAAGAAAKRHGGKVYSDHRAMLDEQKPDIVTIATRAAGRTAIIVDAAEAGVRGIHSEKPLGRNLRECDAAAAAVTERRVAFSYGATRRYMPAYRRARELVASGAFGAARQVLLHFGAGALQWTHPHSVDLALFFTGDRPPHLVQASFAAAVAAEENTIDADPILEIGLMRFAGLSALISTEPTCDVAIACERGVVSVLNDGEKIEIRKPSADEATYFTETAVEPMQPAQSGLQVAFTELRDSILEGTPPSSGIAHALMGQRVLFALALSGLRAGVPISPSEVPPDFTVTGRKGNLFA